MPIERYREKVDGIDAKMKKLELRRENLNPNCRLEVAKIEDHIKTMRAILADGDIKVSDSGLLTGTLWADNEKNDPIPEDYDLFELWDGKEEPDLGDDPLYITEDIAINPDGTEGKTMSLHLSDKEMADFERRDEISMERKRKLLEKFDIKVVAHSDRIEMTGLLPTQTFNNKGDRVFCSP
ncbi:MAG: hypothetical protein SVM79_09415 [Chloroflexota bacterium]|nr:hypothetical protein [Chloroflexota bacterium]